MTTARDIGERLRQAREGKGFTIKQVQEDTKIRRRYIEAMETGEFEVIPGGEVYQRGFVRTYARYLGIDERALMEEWRLLHASPEVEEREGPVAEHREGMRRGRDERGRQGTRAAQTEKKEPLPGGAVVRRAAVRQSAKAVRSRGFLRWGLVLLAILILAFAAGRGFYRAVMEPASKGDGASRISEGTGTPPSSEGTVDQSLEGATEGDLSGRRPQEVGGEPDESGAKAVPPLVVPIGRVVVSEDTRTRTRYAVWGEVAEVELLVTDLTDRCWIRAVADGGRPVEMELQTGRSLNWSVEKELRIRCGRPWAVKIVVNDKEFEPSGRESPPKDFIFEVVKEDERENN